MAAPVKPTGGGDQMISDTLSDAIHSIQDYLDDPATSPCYVGRERRLKALVKRMETMRRELDELPIPVSPERED